MGRKICKRCNKGKNESSYRIVTDARQGKIYVYRINVCIKCERERNKEYGKKDPKYHEKRRMYVKRYRERHPDRIKEYRDRTCATPKFKSRMKAWYRKNKKRVLGRQKEWFQNHMENISDQYIVHLIASETGVKRKEIWEQNDLIKTYQSHIKLQRLCQKLQTSEA